LAIQDVLSEAATEEEKKAQQLRSKKYGISIKEGGNVTKPSKYSNVPDDKFLDPVNFSYPIDTEHLMPALRYFNHDGQREAGGYTPEEWQKMGTKLVKALGSEYEYKNGKVAKKKNEQLNEMWLHVPGSYEDAMEKLNKAISENPVQFKMKRDDHANIKATFADSIIVEIFNYVSDERTSHYYQATWSENDDGEIEFDDIEEVDFEIAVVKINECKELVEEVRNATNTVELNETILTDVVLTEVEIDGKKIFRGKVPIAQRADVRNGNGRVYTVKALENAVTEAQKAIDKYGGLRMEDGHHFDEKGKNKSSLSRTAGIIKKISWNPNEKVIALDEIELVPETEAGKSIKALLDKNYKLQVSQRAIGSSEMIKEDDGQVIEQVDYVKFQGWDFLPGGEASVSDASFEVITEGIKMPDKVLGEKEVTEFVQNTITEAEQRITQTITESITSTLKEAGLLVDEIAEDKTESEKKTEVKDERIETLLREIKSLNERIESGEKVTADFKREKEIAYLRQFANQYLEKEVQKEKYKRFNEEQKKRMLRLVKPEELYGKVDIANENSLSEKLNELFSTQVTIADGYIADMKLKELGILDENGNIKKMSEHGVTRVEINEQTPGMEYMAKLEQAVENRLKQTDSWVMPKGHASEFALNAILKEFDEQNWRQLEAEAKTLTEANEVTQASIGPRVAMISRTIIPIAWRRLTALDVMDVGPTMGTRIVDIPVASWGPAETSELSDDIGSIMVADDGDIPVGGITYANYPLYAVRLALSTEIRSEAIATAKGTSMDPVADSLAGLSRDISTRLDRLFWWMQIAKAQMFTSSYTQKTSYTAMVDKGSNLFAFTTDGSTEITGGLLRYEWVKTVDARGNPTGADIVKLYGTEAGTPTLQSIDVREAAGDNTALVYTDDYSVNWLDGTITLTTAGNVKEANNGLEAKYTYSNATGVVNANFWSAIPPTGVTLYDHLINLRQQVGESKVLVSDRHYQANFIAMSNGIEDLISSGPQFTESGRSPAEVMDRLANVMNYAGLTPTKTSAIPNGYILIGEKGSAVYRVHTPLKMVGPYKIDIKGHDYYHIEEYSGFDVPVMDKLTLVLITDL